MNARLLPTPRDHIADIADRNGWTLEPVPYERPATVHSYRRAGQLLLFVWDERGTAAIYVAHSAIPGQAFRQLRGPMALINARNIFES